MPKATAYCLIWSQEHSVYQLFEKPHQQALPLAPGSDEWHAWVATIPAFTFRGRYGQLTVRQEQRRRGGAYWYAYHRAGKKMLKRYLGKTSEVTLARLEQVAEELAAARAFALRSRQTPTRSQAPASLAKRLREPAPIPVPPLPVQLTPLIGREQEVASATALLRRPEVRLLTMCGAAGIGKTRLALQVVAELFEDFADGVSFVSVKDQLSWPIPQLSELACLAWGRLF